MNENKPIFPVLPDRHQDPNTLGYYAMDLLEQREDLTLDFAFLRQTEKIKKETVTTNNDITDLIDRLTPRNVPPHFNTLVGAERPAVLPEIGNDNLPLFMAGDRQGIAWTRSVFLINGQKEAQTGHNGDSDNIVNTDIAATDVLSFAYAYDGTDWDRIRTISDDADNLATGNPGHVGTMAKLLAFDGVTYDRVASTGYNADSLALPSGGLLHVKASLAANRFDNGTLDRLRTYATTTDGATTPPTGVLSTAAMNVAYNGTTWDRLRGVALNADNIAAPTLGSLQVGAFLLGFDDANFDRLRTVDDSGDLTAGNPGTLGIASKLYHFDNEANNWEHVHGVYQSTLLASAARTANTNSTDQNNTNGKGVHVHINITAWTAGSITVTIQGKDPVSGTYYTILASAALAATGLTVLRVHPGLTAVANLAANDFLPRVWRVAVTVGTADSITYSVGNAVN